MTIVAIIAVSTAVLGGAGYSVYKYQEVQKENLEIKTELEQQKDKEIARLENELNTAKEEVVKAAQEAEENTEEDLEEAPEQVVEEFTEIIPPEPVTPATDEYGFSEVDWKGYDDLSEDLESQRRDVSSLIRQLEKDIESATAAKESALQTISMFPDSTVEYTGRAFVESARNYISAANKTVSRGERYTDTLDSIIDDIYNRDGSSLNYKFDQALEQRDAYESAFDESLIELEKYGGLLNEYLSLFNT